ncbi:hypothetical protein [uncultured Sphingomonas sp.]|nr:hypothetical protein [uncultured Sphingomonas sp.]
MFRRVRQQEAFGRFGKTMATAAAQNIRQLYAAYMRIMAIDLELLRS